VRIYILPASQLGTVHHRYNALMGGGVGATVTFSLASTRDSTLLYKPSKVVGEGAGMGGGG
jgi:hypothetical protein